MTQVDKISYHGVLLSYTYTHTYTYYHTLTSPYQPSSPLNPSTHRIRGTHALSISIRCVHREAFCRRGDASGGVEVRAQVGVGRVPGLVLEQYL